MFALKDAHNSPFNWQQINKIINPDLFKPSGHFDSVSNYIEPQLDMNDPSGEHTMLPITPLRAMGIRRNFFAWDNKNYQDTVQENIQIFEDYLSLLEKYSVYPIVILTPMMKDYQRRFTRRVLDEFNSILDSFLERRHFMFINGWKMKMFNEYDFWDPQHLNIRGSIKFSQILNDVIMNLESKK
ncbi:MAG: hypothetical protein IJ575_06645 [Selenomonadaceae bacterium]|nr:hypothetical protein [Selenomonadaceae bacterium]